MNSCIPTLVADRSLRNQLVEQEWKLVKALRATLTTHWSLTLSPLSMLVFALLSNQVLAQSSSHPFLTPQAVAVQQLLQAPCEQGSDPKSIESLLDGISLAYEMPIWCDRRIARDLVVTMERREESLGSYLNRSISQVDAVLIPLSGVILVCPKKHADEIETAYWKLSASRTANLLRTLGAKPFGWPDGSVVSEILKEFELRCAPDSKWNVQIERDIWRAFEFPKTTASTSICICLLSGFDLCLSEQNGNAELVPIASLGTQVEWNYSKEDVRKIGESAWKAWRTQWPDAEVTKTTKPDGWRVSATPASHRELIGPLIPKKKWDKPKASEVGVDQKTFSGPLEGELERVLRSLAAQTKLDFYPFPLPASLESKRVQLKLDKAKLDDILKEITNQCGVRFRRDGKRVEIIP